MNIRFAPAGRPFTLAVRDAVRTAKNGDPLVPVRVVVPSNIAGLSLRRMLGSAALHDASESNPPGVANVSFSTPFQFASLLAAEAMARSGQRPLTNVVLAAAVRHVLATDPGRFGVVAEHIATEAALMRAFADITAMPLPQREALRGSSLARTVDLVRFVDAVESHLHSGTGHAYHDELAVLTEASQACRSAQLDDALVLAGPFGQGLATVQFLAAAWSASAGGTGALGVFAATGDRDVDEATRAQASAIVGTAVTAPFPDARPPVPSSMLPVADSDEEVRAVVRCVLDAGRNGARFDRMAVFIPSTEPYLRTLREHFDAAGIPTAGPEHRTLADSVAGRLLLRLIDIADSVLTTPHDQRFSRESVLALVEAAPLRGPDGRPVDATIWENISRSAGVVAGLDDWTARLDAHARSLQKRIDDNRAEASAGFVAALERERGAAERLLAFVNWLAELTAPSAIGRSWSDRSAWAQAVLGQLLPASNRRSSWPDAELDAADRVDKILARVGVLDNIEPDLTPAAFVRAIHLELDVPAGRRGRFGTGVLIAPLASAIGLDLDHVFVLGLAEGICPRPVREDTLLPDSERALAGGALPVRADVNRVERERYLHALAAGGVESTVVMPRGDHRSGRLRTASRWWVEAARERTGDASITSQSWSDASLFADVALGSFQQSMDAAIANGLAVSLPDLQLQHVHSARGKGSDASSELLSGPLRRGLAHIDERRAGFGRFLGDLGELDLPKVADVEAAMSSSRLETWATCPRRYFFAQLLGLGEIERPEEITEISALDRGSLWHAIVEDFIGESVTGAEHAREHPEHGWSEEDELRLRGHAERRYREYEELGRTGRQILWAIRREETDSDLQSFLREDEVLRADKRTVPTEVELPFGMDRGEGSEASAAEVALSDGRRLRLRGLIDRVDTRNDGTPVVIDYKTGRAAKQSAFEKDPVVGGTKLQLGVYAEAARQHYGTERAEAYYWYTSTKGQFATAGYPWTPERRDRFIDALDTIVTGIETGVFPPNPGEYNAYYATFDNCSFCDFTRICPADRDEEFERAVASGRLTDFVLMHAGPESQSDDAMDTPEATR